MQEFLSHVSEGTEILLVLSIILFAGFIMTRLTNTLNLPKVSGYILAGILIGPCGLNFIPINIIEHMGFVSDLALAFIAFGVGKFFRREVIMKTGKKVVIITVFEALVAGILVALFTRLVFHLDWDFALILGAIATATAPASTMMTINQYKAKGDFVNTLLQVVALDDVVCLMAFSVVAALASGHESGSVEVYDIVMPIVYNILALLLGFFCGYFLSRLLIPTRSKDNRLILAIAMLLGISGICDAVDISPLLSCMIFGASYINLTRDKKLYRQINNFTPPVMSIFFIVSGMNLDVKALSTVGMIGVSYFIVRIAGKYLGTYISCILTGMSKEIRNYLGLALIPQAGVAIGLAFLGKRLLPPATGNLMLTIILSSSVLYEMVGPISAKAALFLSGSIPTDSAGNLILPEENMGISTEQESANEDSDSQGTDEVFHAEELRDNENSPEEMSGKSTGGVNCQMEDVSDGEKSTDMEMEKGTEEDEEGFTERDIHAVDLIEGDLRVSPSERRMGVDETPVEEEYVPERSIFADIAEIKAKKEKKAESDKKKDETDEKPADTIEEPQLHDSEILVNKINEMNAGVDEEDDFDIEREVKTEKNKKSGKNKKRGKKK